MAARPLALTMGEPGGIGPELAVMAWTLLRASGPAFTVFSDPALLAARAARLGLTIPIAEVGDGAGADIFAEALPVRALEASAPDRPGVADPAGAAAVISAIDAAVASVLAGTSSAVVTNPIHKAALYGAGFAHPGHTEYLGVLAAQHLGRPVRPVMMLACDSLRVVPVTVHIPLADVPGALSGDLIIETARIVDRDLRTRFGLERPRIAVCGLNPHAGENGTMGREDDTIIRPAIERLQAEGLDARGPYPADTLFHAEARRRYDVALGMYHDQALIPIKTLAFDEGVNVTLGLPFVRTSPDHGTALDIAGTGQARVTSLVEALRLAARLAG